MPARRSYTRKIAELLRLQAEALSARQVADSLGLQLPRMINSGRGFVAWPEPAEQIRVQRIIRGSLSLSNDAQGGIRTRTGLLPRDFKSIVGHSGAPLTHSHA